MIKSLNLSITQLPHLQNENNLPGLLKESDELLGTRFLVYSPKHTNQYNRVYANDIDFRDKILILPESVCTL